MNIINNKRTKEIHKNLIKANEIFFRINKELNKLPEPTHITITLDDMKLLLSQCKKPTKDKRNEIKKRFPSLY